MGRNNRRSCCTRRTTRNSLPLQKALTTSLAECLVEATSWKKWSRVAGWRLFLWPMPFAPRMPQGYAGLLGRLSHQSAEAVPG